jgi:hypothetical protein
VNLLIRSNTSLALCVGSRSKCLGRIDTQSFLGSPQVGGGEGLEYQAKSVPLSGDPWCDRRTFGKKEASATLDRIRQKLLSQTAHHAALPNPELSGGGVL